jgi:protein subunit release factor B
MSVFPVGEKKEKALRERMEALEVREEDIEEKFVRSGGKGGQHVNKVSTCVQLRHSPTGVEARCSRERSQALNRYRARVLLIKKIEDMVKGRESEERKHIEKLKRQKRKRSKRAKEKVLAEKKKQAEKKKLRRPVGGGGGEE